MANLCYYEMKIKGSKRTIQRVIACLQAHYNYEVGKPEHKHFFRIFECNVEDYPLVENNDGTFTQMISGNCAWSVWTAMMKGESTYYKGMSESYPEIFMGTCLQEQSRNCEIEIFSEEFDMEFSEHYYLKNGKLVLDDCKDIHKGRNPNRNGWEYNFKYQYIH